MSGIEIAGFILAVILVSSITSLLIRKNLFTGIYRALNSRNYEEFFKRLDSHGARAMLPVYARELLRLRAYTEQNNQGKVHEQFNFMMKLKLNDYQLNALLIRGFEYYMSINDKGKCKKIMDKMKETLPEEQKGKYQRHYDIVFDNSIKYIKDMEAALPFRGGRGRGYLEYLLAKSYEVQNDKEQSLYYYRKAAEDYKTNVKELEQKVCVL